MAGSEGPARLLDPASARWSGVTDIPTEARYVEFRQKCAEFAKKLTGALKRHVECGGAKPRVGGPGESSCSDSLCKESAPIKARTRSIGTIARRRM